MGKGSIGEETLCSDCGWDHVHGQPCVWEGLEKKGWVRLGKDRKGRNRWERPESARQRAKRKRHDRRRVEVNESLASFVGGAMARRKVLKQCLKDIPKAERGAFVSRLDLQTADLWLNVSYGRMAGLSDGQIAGKYGIDRQLIAELVVSPAYQEFEAKVQRVTNDGELSVYIQKENRRLAPHMFEALEWVASLRDVRAAGSVVNAFKAWAAGVGLATEKKTVEGKVAHVHAHLTPKQSESVVEALKREGA